MTIYQGYYSGIHSARPVWSAAQSKLLCEGRDVPADSVAKNNDWVHLRDHLANTNDQFVFIITKVQWSYWTKKLEEYKLKQFVHYEMPYFVSNRRYPNAGRKLRLVILKGKKNED